MIQLSSTLRLNPTAQRKLYTALKRSFPDARVSDQDMLALAICVQRERQKNGVLPPELDSIDLSDEAEALQRESQKIPAEEIQVLDQPDDDYRYYWVDAVHTRHTPAGFEPFTGHLTMARVTLDPTRPRKYKTALGQISPADHLIDTVFEANQKYGRALGYELARVDLITPVRDGLRFGAISVLLGYRNKTDKSPSCYILEAGTATGQPKVLYLGKTIGQPINSYSGYSPTPFACPSHAYLGTLTVKNDDEPDRLAISARAIKNGKSEQPYIDIDIRWNRQTGPIKNIWPGFLIARAAAIVLTRAAHDTIPTDCDDVVPGARS